MELINHYNSDLRVPLHHMQSGQVYGFCMIDGNRVIGTYDYFKEYTTNSMAELYNRGYITVTDFVIEKTPVDFKEYVIHDRLRSSHLHSKCLELFVHNIQYVTHLYMR